MIPRRIGFPLLGMLLASCLGPSVVGSGISVPAGPQLVEYELVERCGQPGDSSCTDRALDIAERILVNLGAAQPPTDPQASLAVPFTIQVDRDPPWEWRASDGTGGQTAVAIVDLEPFLEGRGPALVRIGGDDPGYAVPDELTRELIEALFLTGG